MRPRIKRRLKLKKSMVRKLRVSRMMCHRGRMRVIWLQGFQATLRWSSECPSVNEGVKSSAITLSCLPLLECF